MSVKRKLDQGPPSVNSTPPKNKKRQVIFRAPRRIRLSNPSTAESSATSPDGHRSADNLTLVGPTTFSAPLDEKGIKSPGPTLPKTPLPETETTLPEITETTLPETTETTLTLPLNTLPTTTPPLDYAASALSLEEPSAIAFTPDGTASQVACPVKQSSLYCCTSRQPDDNLWNIYRGAIRGNLWRIGVYHSNEKDPSHQVVGYNDPTDQEWESLRVFISLAVYWSLTVESLPTNEKDHPASHIGLIAHVPVPTSIQCIWRQILRKQHSWSFSNPSFSGPSISESIKIIGEGSDKQWPPGVISLFGKGSIKSVLA